MPALATGIAEIDRREGGLLVGEVVLARSCSRSLLQALTARVVTHVARESGAPVLLLTMERDGSRTAIRLLGEQSGFDPARLRRGGVNLDAEWYRLIVAADSLTRSKLLIDDEPYADLATLHQSVIETVASHGSALLVIEQVDGLVTDSGAPLQEICATLAQIARERRIAVLACERVVGRQRSDATTGATPRAAARIRRHIDSLWRLRRRGRAVTLTVVKGPKGSVSPRTV